MNRTAQPAHAISTNIMNRMRVFESSEDRETLTSIDNGSPRRSETVASSRTSSTSSSSGHCTSSTITAEAAAATAEAATALRVAESAQQYGRTTKMMMSSPPPGVQTDADGLILPKKLINPCLESTDHKQLHRELKFNTKIGKSVLNQKSELQRAYDKQKERQQQHQTQETSPTASLKGELSRVIMERAQKHEQAAARNHDTDEDEDKQYVNPEYLNVRAKLRHGQRAAEQK